MIAKPTSRPKVRRDPVTPELHREVHQRDRGCVGPRVGMPGTCSWHLELDHVRASGGLGMKSPSTSENLVVLCHDHHRVKTLEGRKWRPKLIAYLEKS